MKGQVSQTKEKNLKRMLVAMLIACVTLKMLMVNKFLESIFRMLSRPLPVIYCSLI